MRAATYAIDLRFLCLQEHIKRVVQNLYPNWKSHIDVRLFQVHDVGRKAIFGNANSRKFLPPPQAKQRVFAGAAE